jgi:hypothetical protein
MTVAISTNLPESAFAEALARHRRGEVSGNSPADKFITSFKQSVIDAMNAKVPGSNLTLRDIRITKMTYVRDADGNIIGVTFEYEVLVKAKDGELPEQAAEAIADAVLKNPNEMPNGLNNAVKTGLDEDLAGLSDPIVQSTETSAVVRGSVTIELPDSQNIPSDLDAQLTAAIASHNTGTTTGNFCGQDDPLVQGRIACCDQPERGCGWGLDC